MPARSARSTARVVGALTAVTAPIDAAAAFCTISKLTRPLTVRMAASGERAVEHHGTDHLVDRVVPTHVLGVSEHAASGVHDQCGVHSPGRGEPWLDELLGGAGEDFA